MKISGVRQYHYRLCAVRVAERVTALHLFGKYAQSDALHP